MCGKRVRVGTDLYVKDGDDYAHVGCMHVTVAETAATEYERLMTAYNEVEAVLHKSTPVR
tara:strand:+ start:1234 stop:1413 length:180 start_codon:yes stop_codon:yes gene_type:complete